MRKLLLSVFILFAVVLKAQKKTGEFILNGIIENPQTSHLYLRYTNNEGVSILDSAAIQNGQFQFRGHINEPTLAIFKANKQIIPDDENLNIISFYLEPVTMEVNVTYNEFLKAKFTGSKTQNETKLLGRYCDTIKSNSPTKFESYSNATRAFIRDHPGSFVSLSNLNGYKGWWPIDSVISLFNILSPTFKGTHTGVELSTFIRKKMETAVGTTAGLFRTVDVNGKTVNLEHFRGKYVLLDFWGSWCAPCREGMPHMKEVYKKYKDRRLAVIAVAHENDESDKPWKEAIAKDATQMFIHVRSELKNDPVYKKISDQYFVTSFPTKFLIDPSGKIIGKYLGSDDDSKLDQKLVELFP